MAERAYKSLTGSRGPRALAAAGIASYCLRHQHRWGMSLRSAPRGIAPNSLPAKGNDHAASRSAFGAAFFRRRSGTGSCSRIACRTGTCTRIACRTGTCTLFYCCKLLGRCLETTYGGHVLGVAPRCCRGSTPRFHRHTSRIRQPRRPVWGSVAPRSMTITPACSRRSSSLSAFVHSVDRLPRCVCTRRPYARRRRASPSSTGTRSASGCRSISWRPSGVQIGQARRSLQFLTARPSLGTGQHLADVPDRLTPTRRAQKFPREASFRIEMSRAWSATRLFNRWFSRSSSFRRRLDRLPCRRIRGASGSRSVR